MSLPRTRFALLLVVALAAMALSTAVDVANGATSERESSEDVSLTVRAVRVNGLATRLTSDERRDLTNTERTLKHRLVLFAVLVGILWAARSAWQATVAHGRDRRPMTSRWSPRAGRSPPPPFHLSIV